MLSKKLTACVLFARFMEQQNLNDPLYLAELLDLKNRAFQAGCRAADAGNDKADAALSAARKRVEQKAAEKGYTTQWSGLYPTLQKNGKTVYFPF